MIREEISGKTRGSREVGFVGSEVSFVGRKRILSEERNPEESSHA
jgi:hypothetical protein